MQYNTLVVQYTTGGEQKKWYIQIFFLKMVVEIIKWSEDGWHIIVTVKKCLNKIKYQTSRFCLNFPEVKQTERWKSLQHLNKTP